MNTYAYDSFGTLINRTGTTPNDYLYAGEQFDANLGFYYLRARYMNPSNGRFFTMDSYEGSRFETQTLHKYLYANNQPVNMADPSGEFAVTSTELIGGLFVLSTLALISYYALVIPHLLRGPIPDLSKPDTTTRSQTRTSPKQDPLPFPDPDPTPEPFPEPAPFLNPRERVRRTPDAHGVYHLQARNKYTGSARSIRTRLIDPRHTNAWQVLAQPGVRMTIWLVTFTKKQPSTERDWERALRAPEQEIMDNIVPPNIPRQDGSLNDRRAAEPANKRAWLYEYGTVIHPPIQF